MAVNLSPIGGVAAQFLDNSGNPLSGGKIYTYAAGTTTPQASYTSSNGATAHSNPIILDAAGRVPSGEIWLTDGLQYKFLIKTSADVQIGSYDNIIGINSNFVNYTSSQEIQSATAGQTVFTLTTMAYQPGTNSLSVFVDGVNQYGPGASYAYQETSDTVVTFTSGLHVGALVKFTTSAINSSAATDAEQVGYVPPFTGSVATNVEAKLAQTVSVKDFGAVGDGITNDTAAIQAANAVGTTVYYPNGNYLLNSNTTLTSDLLFADGAEIAIPGGVTLTINANINAPNREIFSGAGTVALDRSPTGYNLSWFKTTNGYINERFDFAKRGMVSFNNKIIRIPHPYAGQSGTSTSGTRIFWLFSAPLVFTDAQNTSKVYVEGEFLAANNTTAFMEFNDAAKPESIFFYGAIQAQATATQTVDVGIDIKAAARIQFFCNVLLNGFQTSMRIGSPDMVAAVGDVYVPMLQTAFFYNTGLLIYGLSASFSCQGIYLGQVNVTAAQTAGLSAVKIGGLVRTINIGEIFYATDIAKDGYAANDAQNALEIFSDDTHLLAAHIKIGGIYQANANNGLKITSTASVPAGADLRFITVDRIFGKFNGGAADIDYCQYVTINGIENFSDVTIGSNAAYTTLNSNNGGLRTLTNNGLHSLINSVGSVFSGGGTAPSPAVEWPIGTFVRETGDNRVYLRVAKAGAATDFIMVRGALRGTTAARPTLTTTDIGQLYFDTTLAANGKPIWWIGFAWVDATGATV